MIGKDEICWMIEYVVFGVDCMVFFDGLWLVNGEIFVVGFVSVNGKESLFIVKVFFNGEVVW